MTEVSVVMIHTADGAELHSVWNTFEAAEEELKRLKRVSAVSGYALIAKVQEHA